MVNSKIMSIHEMYMRKVLELATFTARQTLPNPQVAAILVNDGQIVGMGCHLKSGEPHAEIYALTQAKDRARGAILYINLEPCCHTGKTGPCCEALIAAGVSEVYIANLDPNPLVAGKGVARLKSAGIKVHHGLLAKEAAEINRVFFHNIVTNEPYVTIKVAMSLDGKIATKANLSQWISNISCRKDAHVYRASHDGILVGVNTVISDDPSLTPYLIEGAKHSPVRIILDRHLRTPLQSKLVTDASIPTWICTCNSDELSWQPYLAAGVKILYFPQLEIRQLLQRLYQENIYSLMVEGGEGIYSSFLDAKAVNCMVIYYSPQLIGSLDAKHFYSGNGFADLQSNLKLELASCENLDGNLKVVLQLPQIIADNFYLQAE